jgi:hypothetical protein
MYTRKAVLPLLEYYVATENWERAEYWFETLAGGLLSTVFALQRLRFLKASYALMEHFQEVGKSDVFLPKEVAPISPKGNGQLEVRVFKEWLGEEINALTKIIDKRNK